MKKILGLDLGTNSIGWALVNEAEDENEKSSITKVGVRVIHYDNFVSTETGKESKEPEKDFKSGKGISPNAGRTKKRTARRNLQRFKLRKENLINILKENGIITDETLLSENGNGTTFETYRLRAEAVKEEVTLEQFVRILLMINGKRGYKSSRRAKSQDEGQLIDGMEIAKKLYHENITPGQLVYQILNAGKKYIPDFYRSDLQAEYEVIWNFQKQFYPSILTDELKEELQRKNEKQTWAICAKPFDIVGIKRTTKGAELQIENYTWRVKAISEQLNLEQLAIVFQKINGQIGKTSGYLGSISDRSKELFFNKQTVGQYLMAQLDQNPHTRLKNQVFYRQDYLDEFNTIWESQAKFHKELTNELKSEIRDVIIFYQRRLRSQKGLINFCEFENNITEYKKDIIQIKKCQLINSKNKTITVLNQQGNRIKIEEMLVEKFFKDFSIDGKLSIKELKQRFKIDDDEKLFFKQGQHVIPKSSPLFQEFKIWQILNSIQVIDKTDAKRFLNQEEKEILFCELNLKDKISKKDALKLLYKNHKDLDLNYEDIEGNRTQASLFKTYQTIIEMSGHGEYDFSKMQSAEILEIVVPVFKSFGYCTDILFFNSNLEGKEFEEQALYKLWHLLYSFEGDNSNTGNEKLITKITELYGFEKEYATMLSNINFQPDYGSLCTKAIRKILPHLKEGNEFSLACEYAGYRHSKSSLTRKELDDKVLKDKLDVLPKNSLRNPVVEKILNQMINVVNAAIESYGKPDEIRIELARELKKSAKEREELTTAINNSTAEHEKYREILQKKFGFSRVSRNDIIRYKLYQELESRGYQTLYSNTYISPTKLFSKEFDIEHIIPQSRLFDDSFSNKTIESRSVNIEKGNETAIDFVQLKYGAIELEEYLLRIEKLFSSGKISKTKYNKLKMKGADIPSDFIARDLRDTQYIAKKAKNNLEEIVKEVVSTTGSITDRLREDWQLIDVMQELNWDKYEKLGLTETIENREGHKIKRIIDWTKRNDHRHHAMDALTIAFTKRSHIQYLNNLNARSDKAGSIYGIEAKELYRDDKGKLKFKPPIPLNDFRFEAKRHLENTLISIKAKNKVSTININTTKKKNGVNKKQQLTPRGQLHQETVYGKIDWSRIKLTEKISRIEIQAIKDQRLKQFIENHIKKHGSIKNAFSKENLTTLIFKDKLITELTINIPCYTQKIDIQKYFTDNKKSISARESAIESIIDVRNREILYGRYLENKKDFQKAFSNLDENPIWLNKEKGIAIKRVTITGISNAESLHDKKDKDGNYILDENGNKQAVDFVNTGNNHHTAIYRDENGNLQDKVIPFFDATERVSQGLPIIDKTYKNEDGWEFLFSLKQNEYFVFPNAKTGFNPKEIDLLNPDNYQAISPNLFRVQKFSKVIYGNSAIRDYVFRHHLETILNDNKSLKDITFKSIKSLPIFNEIVKVRVNHIGQIVSVGEY